MDGATFEREVALNRAAYEQLREQIRREHGSEYVALGNGRILATAVSFDEVRAAVEALQRVPEYYVIFLGDDEPAFEPFYAY